MKIYLYIDTVLYDEKSFFLKVPVSKLPKNGSVLKHFIKNIQLLTKYNKIIRAKRYCL